MKANGKGCGWLSCLLLLANFSMAQYTGGTGKGDGAAVASGTGLDGTDLQPMYGGGQGQGSTAIVVFASGLDGVLTGTLYTGGLGYGDWVASLSAQTLSGENLNLLFTGGGGRGDQKGTINTTTLGGQATDIIYYGGGGRGDMSKGAFQQALFDCAVQNIWTGATSTEWAEASNWSCHEVPGINAEVLIPSGRPRYPKLSTSTEIRRITLDPGASLQVNAGQSLKLNGQ